jgi:hypothetical protein
MQDIHTTKVSDSASDSSFPEIIAFGVKFKI